MKGYHVSTGYMGYLNGRYMLFATEEEYEEIVKGDEDGGAGTGTEET